MFSIVCKQTAQVKFCPLSLVILLISLNVQAQARLNLNEDLIQKSVFSVLSDGQLVGSGFVIDRESSLRRRIWSMRRPDALTARALIGSMRRPSSERDRAYSHLEIAKRLVTLTPAQTVSSSIDMVSLCGALASVRSLGHYSRFNMLLRKHTVGRHGLTLQVESSAFRSVQCSKDGVPRGPPAYPHADKMMALSIVHPYSTQAWCWPFTLAQAVCVAGTVIYRLKLIVSLFWQIVRQVGQRVRVTIRGRPSVSNDFPSLGHSTSRIKRFHCYVAANAPPGISGGPWLERFRTYRRHSERTLAACLTHASRTRKFLRVE